MLFLSPCDHARVGMCSCYCYSRVSNCHFLENQFPFWVFAILTAFQFENIQWHVDWLALVLVVLPYCVNHVPRLHLSCENGSWDPFWVEITLVSPWTKGSLGHNCTDILDPWAVSPVLWLPLKGMRHVKVWIVFCRFTELEPKLMGIFHSKCDISFDVGIVGEQIIESGSLLCAVRAIYAPHGPLTEWYPPADSRQCCQWEQNTYGKQHLNSWVHFWVDAIDYFSLIDWLDTFSD